MNYTVKEESCFPTPEHNSDIEMCSFLEKKNTSHGINIILLKTVILCNVRASHIFAFYIFLL
jgi:hypothetical protein